MIYGTVSCLGDSLTAGARDRLGYPEHLGSLLRQQGQTTEWITINHGISGETTLEILRRTHQVATQLSSMPGTKWLVIWAGTNDSKADGMDRDIWRSLYESILHWGRRYQLPMVLCTYPRVSPGEMSAFTNNSNLWLESISEDVRNIAAVLDCDPSPIRICEMTDLTLWDGVHMTPESNLLAAQRICDVITCANFQ